MKRLLLILAAALGLILLGSVLASNSTALVRGAPRNRLAYTLIGLQSGARATAFYTPHATEQGKPTKTAGR